MLCGDGVSLIVSDSLGMEVHDGKSPGKHKRASYSGQ